MHKLLRAVVVSRRTGKDIRPAMVGDGQGIGAQEFEQQLRAALSHLYDPAYEAAEDLYEAAGCDRSQGMRALQAALLRAIESLRPAPDAPPSARSRRIYDLLSYRYVQGLTQEETADRLGITPRHLRREQQEAIRLLAGRLGAQLPGDHEPRPAGKASGGDVAPPEVSALPWRAQVRQELASLHKATPHAAADVREAIARAVKLGAPLVARRGVTVEIGHVAPGVMAAIHATALHQVLIAAIGQVVERMRAGQIALRAGCREGRVSITVTGRPATVDGPLSDDLMREILTAQGGSVEMHEESDLVSLEIEIPAVDEVTVLVVDDNADLEHFYRRYTANTRYRLVNISEGQHIFEAVAAYTPDVIVLDIMLPDVDGWELLAQLHDDPATQPIPVIVCSVTNQEELALSLGAALCLGKPVRRQAFIQALDQAVAQAPRGF